MTSGLTYDNLTIGNVLSPYVYSSGAFAGTTVSSGAVYTPAPSEYVYKNLYQVFCVDTDGDILIDEVVVAKNDEEAKFNSKVYELLALEGLSFDDVTILVKNQGSVKISK